MSKLAITFADELRARSDEDLAALFKFRPDLVTPVPNDFTSLAARAAAAHRGGSRLHPGVAGGAAGLGSTKPAAPRV